jgi:hypothetical protein
MHQPLELESSSLDIVVDVVQNKQESYVNRDPTNQFLPLAIEVFGCLHKHVDMFLHNMC